MTKRDSGPSFHLSWNELACHDGTPYPDDFVTDGRVYKLARIFEEIRLIWGKPIKVLSGYRTVSYNRLVNGAIHSQHIEGRALDLSPPEGVDMTTFYNTIKNRIKDLGIKGLGKYPTWVHIDIRPTERVAYWSGKGAS